MKFLLRTGGRYKASLRLSGFFERHASNDNVASRLCEAGFVGVTVEGSGADRVAWGEWSGAERDVDLPEQVVSVEAIT